MQKLSIVLEKDLACLTSDVLIHQVTCILCISIRHTPVWLTARLVANSCHIWQVKLQLKRDINGAYLY